jgi:hypothetical protein
MTRLVQSRVAVVSAAILVGPIAGALAVRKPALALLACLGVIGLLALASLGDRAFPWAVMLVAVAPWYPLTGDGVNAAPLVRQLLFCIAIIAAVLVPTLWSVAQRENAERARPNRLMLLLAILSFGFIVLVFSTVGLKAMIQSGTVGFLLGGITFLCARHFGDPEPWMAASFGGLMALALLGFAAFALDPGDRVGAFSGYAITYGALVVLVLPGALVWAARRSGLLAFVVAAMAGALLILSQSRSSWLAAVGMVFIVMLLLARRGDYRLLFYVSTGLVVALVLIFTTGSLHRIVEQRINSSIGSSESATHREFSLHYVTGQVHHRPVVGAADPGYAAQQVGAQTDITAVDNGYGSISVDMGLLGLLVALFPIGVAAIVLTRSLRLGIASPPDIALALGIVGVAVVTLFYDSYYWAQLDLLMFAMGGVLSARLAAIPRPRVVWRSGMYPEQAAPSR